MIDLHIHILPGLDDGPPNIEEAVEMCRVSFEDGINSLVATPHIVREVYENRRRAILEAVEILTKELSEKMIPIKILPGADARLDYDLIDRLEEKEFCTINDGNKYLLLEIPETLSPRELIRCLSGLKKRGVRPIVSHPERNPLFLENVEILYNLVHSGILLQITTHSLLGVFGKKIEKFTERLLEHHLVHILASDAHSLRVRPPGLQKALRKAGEIVGEQAARALVVETPAKIIKGDHVVVPIPKPWKDPPKYRWMSWFRNLQKSQTEI